MPVSPTFPGVYIEEVPSGVRTITGVATSITAFIGRAARGPTEEPITITSFADYERMFGGLDVDSMMSYAVRDFYQNGGSQALIVRIVNGATSALLRLPTGGSADLVLQASSPGSWANTLSALVDYNTAESRTDLFNLTISEQGGATEKFFNVSTSVTDPRYVARVLKQSSALVQVQNDSSGNPVVPANKPLETFDIASPPSSPPKLIPDPVVVLAADRGSDGSAPTATQFEGDSDAKTGIFALDRGDLFNLLSIPPATRGGDTQPSTYQQAMQYCAKRRAMLLVDPPAAWGARADTAAAEARDGLTDLNLTGPESRNAALYFPRVLEVDPLRDRQLDTFVPSGIIAGVMARTDSQRGVWKAPAGLDATLNGIQSLRVNLIPINHCFKIIFSFDLILKLK